MRFVSVLSLAGICLALVGCGRQPQAPVQLVPEVIETYSFDPVFVQGLERIDAHLLVSIGRYGSSAIEYRDLPRGEVHSHRPLPAELFGEGASHAANSVWQLTWKEGVVIRRDPVTLDELERFPHEGQGWGVCSFDPEAEAADSTLFVSDGSATIRAFSAQGWTQTSSFTVRDSSGQEISRLNELECASFQGAPAIFANVFQSDHIVVIDPSTGALLADIDAHVLSSHAPSHPDNVLNGIAAVEGTDRFYLTGKNWPVLYEVRFVEAR